MESTILPSSKGWAEPDFQAGYIDGWDAAIAALDRAISLDLRSAVITNAESTALQERLRVVREHSRALWAVHPGYTVKSVTA